MPLSLSPAPAPATLVALLRWRAHTAPDRRAYVFLGDGESETAAVTHAELDARARAIAARLQTRTAPGDRALLLYPPGLEFLAGFFGCLYAGVIAVPSYPPKRNRPDHRLQAIAIDAGAQLVLTDSGVLGELEHRLQNTPELRALDWLATDTIAAGDAAGWRELVVQPKDLAFLQYTSGSTSTPKGVMVSHSNLLHNLDDLDRGWEHTADSVMVTWLPIFHDMGLIYGALMPLFKSFLCVMLPPPAFLQRPSRWLEAITRFRGTHSAAPNFAYDLCVASTTAEQRAAFDLRSWHMSLNAAEPVRAETLEAFNAAFAPCGLSPLTVSPGFGLAEATLKVCALPRAEPTRFAHVRSDELARHRVVLGTPGVPGVQAIVGCGWGQVDNRFLVVDPETGALSTEAAVGEIWFAGPSVAQGYWNRPEETAATFHAKLPSGDGPFMRTGDLGFMRAGEVFVTGRVKDMIIVRGLNHYPQDIELTVEKCHAALRPSCGAAFSIEVEGREALILAQEIERTHLRKLNVEEVVAAIRGAVVEKHELPVHAIALLRTGSIPKTSSGKIQRRACRQLFLDAKFELVGEWRQPAAAIKRTADAPDPIISLESAVIATWIAVRLAQRLGLPVKRIDPREPFSNYGLDSLAAVELSGALESWLGRRLSPTLVYDYPNVQALADYLAVATATAPAELDAPSAPIGNDPVAIIGLGCRFPGADSPAAFWELLSGGGDAITRVPAGRWAETTTDAPHWGGFLKNVDTFDAEFFGIAPREADLMDPQQRLLLEVAYEALEDAGLPPAAIAGTRAGVFVGISTNDYGRLLARQPAGTDAHAGTGNAFSVAANRISYLLDLRGPSLAIDTACSSSLVAVHHAVRSLRSGECGLALVGGVNLLLAPDLTTTFARAGMLAPDGRCKTFDAAADGYVRGEGCGVVVLKRLSDAQRDGDRVLAVVRGSAVNQDGRSNGLTAPNGPAQQAVVRAALRDADLAPSAVGYVEAHGTGTTLGDPIEVNSLREVLFTARTEMQPCWLGSVKTNIGHLEAAAGIAGLIKVVLALRHRALPAHLHLRSVNPLIHLADTPLAIPTALTPWPETAAGGRVAGVSSFGFGGTNSHVIVAEAPVEAAREIPVRPGSVLVLSAKTVPALRALAARHATHLLTIDPAAWPEVCHTAAVHRGAFPHRLALAAGSAAEAAAPLGEFAREGTATGVWSGEASDAPRVAFLFSGQGSLFAGAGLELYASQPVFRTAVGECRAIITARAGWDVIDALGSAEKLARTEFAQVALFTLEIALARTWAAWGVEPVAVVGHSVGEYAAAVIAGAFTLDAALTLLISRARLMGALGENGAMLAVDGGADELAEVVARHGLEVAAINSPRQTVLTGARVGIAAVAAELIASGRRVQDLGVRQGYHSREMDAMLPAFAASAAEAKLGAPTKFFASTVTGGAVTGELATSDYWVKQIRQPVRLAEAIRAVHGTGATLLIEIGPRGILAALGQQSWPDQSGDWLVSLQPGRGEWAQLLESVGRAFVVGAPVRWTEVDRGFDFRPVALPPYPFQRLRHWFAEAPNPAVIDPLAAWLGGSAGTDLGELLAADSALSSDDRAAATRVLAALRRVGERRALADSLRDSVYEIRWPQQTRAQAPAAPAGRWLAIGETDPALVAAFAACGQILQHAAEITAGEWRAIIFVAGNSAVEAEAARLVRVTQMASAAPLWIVTRGAVATSPDDARALRVEHASLWGIGKVFALEHPERWGALIDLPAQPAAADFVSLVEELLARAGEDQVALRGAARHVARLESVLLPDSMAPQLRADAAYWVTGGTGALGLKVARELVERGARKLVLTSRRAPSTSVEATIQKFRGEGVDVRVMSADVSQPEEVRRVLSAATAELAPIRGIVHAAGVIGQESLASLTPETLADVLRPKVAGALAIDAATRELPLDFFVLFSSIASVWGAKGQAHYAAANHTLDALAHRRRALGLPALSVNWGPWAGGGMAGEAEREFLARMGVKPLAPGAALLALNRLMSGDTAQAMVASIDWSVFKDLFEARGSRPFLANVGSPAATAAEAGPSMEVEALGRVPVVERKIKLEAFLQGHVAAVLGFKDGRLPDVRQGFFALGMDSLVAVELRNRLGRAFGQRFSATLVFDYANIRLLAGHLAREVFGWSDAVTAAPEVPAPAIEGDLDAALAARLARLETLVKDA
jgi:acyl transferase domain-containing protein/acyl-CoA synthetase (AMP-forming)/AMP-acid ligase II/acyl carrier protein